METRFKQQREEVIPVRGPIQSEFYDEIKAIDHITVNA